MGLELLVMTEKNVEDIITEGSKVIKNIELHVVLTSRHPLATCLVRVSRTEAIFLFLAQKNDFEPLYDNPRRPYLKSNLVSAAIWKLNYILNIRC